MVCKAEGSPQPWVEWRRANHQVGDAIRHTEAVLAFRVEEGFILDINPF